MDGALQRARNQNNKINKATNENPEEDDDDRRSNEEEKTNKDNNSYELPDISLTKSERSRIEKKILLNLNFIYTNARSIKPKIQSLYDAFNDLNLAFALITETWMKKGRKQDEAVDEATNGQGLKILYKNRQETGSDAAGGGVAVVFDPSKITLKQYPLRKSKYELMCVVGKIKNVP